MHNTMLIARMAEATGNTELVAEAAVQIAVQLHEFATQNLRR